jgi:hypothetical protein
MMMINQRLCLPRLFGLLCLLNFVHVVFLILLFTQGISPPHFVVLHIVHQAAFHACLLVSSRSLTV